MDFPAGPRPAAPTGDPAPPRADLEQVFRAYYPGVLSVARRVLGGEHGAEDVAQEVFVAFARSDVPAREAGGWLTVAAGHTALNLLRSRRRRDRRELGVESDPALARPATGPDPAEDVVRRLEHSRVRAGLAALPRPQALALVLRHSGLSYAEIADALGCAPGGVGTLLRRAEAALRKELVRDESPS